MNYIYDILLNFHRQLYDFFEWDQNDNIVHIRKIPLYRIDSKTMLNARDYRIKIDSEFLGKLKNKTEVFANKNVETMEYATLLTDGSSVLALRFNHDGYSLGKSTLLVDEDVEVLEVSNRLKEISISYEKVEKEFYAPLKTRKEQKIEKFIKEELKKSKKEQAYEKLSYLYFECFGHVEDSIDFILSQFYHLLQEGRSDMILKLYDFFKLTSVPK